MPGESKTDKKKRTAKTKKFHSLTLTTCFLLCLAATIGGCMVGGGPELVAFSPDGSKLAYVWKDFLCGIDWITRSYVTLESEYVRWCSLDSPQRQHCIKIHTKLHHDGGADCPAELVFSPNSRYLARISPLRVVIIDLATKRHWCLNPRGEYITSFVWLGYDEVIYTSFAKVPGGPDTIYKTVYNRTVWRQRIHGTNKARVPVFHEDGLRSCGTYGYEESFSPDGRYVVFTSSGKTGDIGGQLKLLDVATATVHTLDRQEGELMEASWKPNSSCLFCLVQMGPIWKPEYKALLVNPAKPDILNLGRKCARDCGSMRSDLNSLWTAEGAYVVCDSTCCLIQPNPWKVINLKEKLIRHLKTTEQTGSPYLHPLSVPGWLYTRHKGKTYAVDYQGRQFVPIADEWDWAVSPDGKRIAEVNEKGKVTVRPLNLPAQPTTQPTLNRTDR